VRDVGEMPLQIQPALLDPRGVVANARVSAIEGAESCPSSSPASRSAGT